MGGLGWLGLAKDVRDIVIPGHGLETSQLLLLPIRILTKLFC